MFATTLRIDDTLGAFLQAAAKQCDQSVNAFLADLLRREQEAARRQRLASDWSSFAQDAAAQDVAYAMPAQAELVAEAQRGYRAPRRHRP